MNLADTLRHLAGVYNLDADELIYYAEEDDVGGYHSSPAKQKWGMGSIWGVEGQVLYALIRATYPQNVIEVGTFNGCSTTHIARALQRNGSGRLLAIDDGSHGGNYTVPEDLKDIVKVLRGDAVEFWDDNTPHYDFFFQDSKHTREHVAEVFEAALPKAKHGAFLVAHDAMHYLVGPDVVAGMRDAGLEPEVVNIEPANCGLAFYRNLFYAESGRLYHPDPEVDARWEAIAKENEVPKKTNFSEPIHVTNWEGVEEPTKPAWPDEKPDQIDADYSDLKKAELEEALLDRGINPEDITGTGANGNVLKDDLIKALETDDLNR